MLLKEILQRLCEGEFSSIASGYILDGSPLNEHHAGLVRHIDMGLLELYKRFPLRIREAYIQQYDHIQNYVLHSQFAVTNTESSAPTQYIEDTPLNKFTDSDFLCIDKLFNEIGEEVPLNDYHKCNSMFTSAYNTIQVPCPSSANVFLVHYRAGHTLLPVDEKPDEVEVHCPYSHLEALLYYVAHRKLASTHADESNMYLMKFEQSCNKIKELNLMNQDNTQGEQFYLGGWV